MKGAAAVVLAAGASSRMGRPKQLLAFRGQSLLRRAARVALEAGRNPVAVVLGAEAARVRPELAGLAVTVAVNPDWEDGPGTSVRLGLAAVEAADPDAVLFLLCDQPLVDAEHLCRLLAEFRVSGRPMVASAYAGVVGVPALFARECFAALRSLPPAAGARQLLSRNPDAVTAVPFPAGAVDLDTPADYEQLTKEVAYGQVD